MLWLKIVIFVMFSIALTTCLVIAKPDNVVSSVIDSSVSNKSKLDSSQILTSVHEAMKFNHNEQLSNELTDDKLGRIGLPPIIAVDNRNKRNTNNVERSDYYYYPNPQESYSNTIGYADSKDARFESNTMCQNPPLSKENEFSISITQGISSISSVAFAIGKIVFGLIAVLMLPLFMLKALLIPIKLLLGIKTFMIIKSMFFSALAWRFLQNLNVDNSDEMPDEEDAEEDVLPGVPSTSNINQINSDFGEMNLRDIKRILRYVKEKHKDW